MGAQKFLETAELKGFITPALSAQTLRVQREARTNGVNDQSNRVGELLVRHRRITADERDTILSLQKEKLPVKRDATHIGRSSLYLQLGLAGLATVFWLLGVIWWKWKPGDTASIVALGWTIVAAIINVISLRFETSWLLRIYRGSRPFLLLALLPLALLVMTELTNLRNVVASHPATIRGLVEAYVQRLQVAIVVIVGLAGLVALYAVWKYKAVRYLESRINAVSDLMAGIENQLADGAMPMELRKHQATERVLRNLQLCVSLSPWDWLLRRLRVIDSDPCTAIFYLEPDVIPNVPDPQAAALAVRTAYYPNAPHSVIRMYQWIETNYRPVQYDAKAYDAEVLRAKAEHHDEWERALARNPALKNIVSFVGYSLATGKCIRLGDCENSTLFDNSYLIALHQNGYPKQDIEWITVRSAMACPVGGANDTDCGVVLVTKNFRNGFREEDDLALVAACQLLRRIQNA